MTEGRPEAATPARYAKWSLAILVAVNILNFYDRHVAGAVVEPVRKEFGLSDTQIGLINTAFTVLYGLVGLPLGRLADKVSRKKLLSVGIIVWAALTACTRWVFSYPMLVVTRLGVGVGEAACAPTATSWIGDLYPPARRAGPLALFMLGVPIGGALSFFFSGQIAQAYGWRWAMIWAAAPALLLIPLLLTLHEPARGASEPHETAPAGSFGQVLRIPAFWWIAISGALVNFNLYAIGTFMPAFFARIHHMNVAQAGIKTGWVYAVGGILGGFLAGMLGDRVVRGSCRGRMVIAAVASLVSAPLAYMGIHQSYGALAVALPLLTLTYGLLNMYYGLVYASLQEIVAPALRGTSMAIYFVVMYLGGASWGTIIIGSLSDKFARHAATLAGSEKVTEAFKAAGLQQAMLVIPVLSLGLALVLWAGSRTIGRDMERFRSNAAQALS
ncbi:MAG TPA: MFS transporter [Verrucomicrobiae bacterium]|jgi:MFS family permease|nr:MFS transporter [Verrucomicrobiae bacterium]